jgi:iron complex transport system substrate-binding protein
MFSLLFGLALASTPVPADARVVTLGGAVTETVCALGRCASIAAADASSTAPAEVAPRATLGFHRRISAEGVLSVRPDLVLTTGESGPPEAIAQIRASGVRVVEVPGEATAAGAIARIHFLGELLGAPDQAARLADGLKGELAAVASAVAGAPKPRVLFVYARGGGTMMVAGRDTAAGELIGLAGGVNAIFGFEGYKALTAEAAVLARPDVVLVTTGGFGVLGGAAGVWQAPGLARTPAGQRGRLVVVDDLLLLGFGPRLGEAVRTVARGLHPERVR